MIQPRRQFNPITSTSLATVVDQLPVPSTIQNLESEHPAAASSSHRSSRVSVEKGLDYMEKLKKVLEADVRTDYEGQLIYEEVKSNPFFDSLNDQKTNNCFERNAFAYLCKKAKFERHSTKQIIFKEGDPCNGKIYLVYSGEVTLLTMNKSTNLNLPTAATIATESVNQDDPEPNTLTNAQSIKESLVFRQTNYSSKPEVGPKSTKSITTFQDVKLPTLTPLSPIKPRRSRIGFSPTFNKNNVDTLKVLVTEIDSPDHSARSSQRSATRSVARSGRKPAHRSGRRATTITKTLLFANSTTIPDEAGSRNRSNSKSRTMFPSSRGKEDSPILIQESSHQPAQEDKSVHSDNKKRSTVFLKSKLKAVAKLTLGSIKINKAGKNSKRTDQSSSRNQSIISEEQESTMITLSTLLAEHGTLVSRVEQGGFFGEKALQGAHNRSQTAIVSSNCELLVINRRDFQYMTQHFNNRRKHMLEFMIGFIPDIENISAFDKLEILMSTLKERTYERGAYIVQEGELEDTFFMLSDGTCEVIKNVRIDESVNPKDKSNAFKKHLRVGNMQSYQIPVCGIQKGVFIGEEIMYKDRSTYNFSVRVTSVRAKVFSVSKTDFMSRFSATTNSEVRRVYEKKIVKYANLIKDQILTKLPDVNLVHDFYSEKDRELYLNQEQVIVRPKPKNTVQCLKTESDYPVRSSIAKNEFSPGRRSNLSPTKIQDEMNLNESLEMEKQRTITVLPDMVKVRRNINPFMRNVAAPNRSPHLLNSPSPVIKTVASINRDEYSHNKLDPSINLDTSPDSINKLYIKPTYTVSPGASPLLKHSVSTDGLHGKSRPKEVRMFTDSSLADLGSPAAFKEPRSPYKSKKLMSQKLDEPDRLILTEIPEASARRMKARLSIKPGKSVDMLASPGVRNGDRITKLIDKAKKKIKKRKIIAEQSLTCKSSIRLPEIESPSICVDLASRALTNANTNNYQIFHTLADLSNYNATHDDRSPMMTKGVYQKIRTKNSIILKDLEHVVDQAGVFETRESPTEEKPPREIRKSFNEQPKGYREASKERQKNRNHESMLKSKHKVLLQIKGKVNRNVSPIGDCDYTEDY